MHKIELFHISLSGSVQSLCGGMMGVPVLEHVIIIECGLLMLFSDGNDSGRLFKVLFLCIVPLEVYSHIV